MYSYELADIDVLLGINQEECFLHYFTSIIGKHISPLRNDNNAGAFFWYDTNGILFFVDFANTPTHLNCIDFIAKKELLSKNDVISRLLKNDFSTNNTQNIVKKTIINISEQTKPFNLNDKLYWGQYNIEPHDINDTCSALDSIKVHYSDNTSIVYNVPQLAFVFYNKLFNCKKIYYPKQGGRRKIFYGDCKKDTIWGYDKQQGDVLIITKSYKDCKVLKINGFRDVIWFNSETIIPKNLCKIITKYRKIIIFYDNDKTGISRANSLYYYIAEKCSRTTDKYFIHSIFNTKDVSDYMSKYRNISFVKNELKKIILL